MQDEIERFLRSYRDAYNRLDPGGIAAHVALPSLLVARDCVLWTTREQVQSNMEGLVRLMMQGPDDAVADVLWTIRRGAAAPWRFHTGYNLHRTAEGWRILLCTAYDEQRARGDEG
jgi:hypothetical protein